MRQVESQGLIGFQFEDDRFPQHVFGGRNGLDQGNFAYSGGRDRKAAQKVRQTWCEFLNCDWNRLVVGGQTHSNNVLEVDKTHSGRGALAPETVLPETDALLTTSRDLPLYIAVADCAGILLASKEKVGLVHAGWRGLQSNILQKALLSFPLDEVVVGIGPCISAHSYEVGIDVAQHAPEGVKYKGKVNKWQLDIGRWAHLQLLECGLKDSQIEFADIDTGTDERTFSHRRQGKLAGRNGLVVYLRD